MWCVRSVYAVRFALSDKRLDPSRGDATAVTAGSRAVPSMSRLKYKRFGIDDTDGLAFTGGMAVRPWEDPFAILRGCGWGRSGASNSKPQMPRALAVR